MPVSYTHLAFKLRTIRMGALLYLLLMVINSSAMFVNVFAGVGMHLDNLQNASLGNWCMVGYAIGAVVAMVLGCLLYTSRCV